SNCGKPMPQEITEWTCECGQKNTGKFCTNCGKPLPVNTEWTCECGQKNTGKFCSNCGKPRA
ncbi:MAG: virion core protein, partial [Agathobacter rectalis]